MIIKSVLLPQPLGPSRQMNSPGAIAIFTELRAVSVPLAVDQTLLRLATLMRLSLVSLTDISTDSGMQK